MCHRNTLWAIRLQLMQLATKVEAQAGILLQACLQASQGHGRRLGDPWRTEASGHLCCRLAAQPPGDRSARTSRASGLGEGGTVLLRLQAQTLN